MFECAGAPRVCRASIPTAQSPSTGPLVWIFYNQVPENVRSTKRLSISLLGYLSISIRVAHTYVESRCEQSASLEGLSQYSTLQAQGAQSYFLRAFDMVRTVAGTSAERIALCYSTQHHPQTVIVYAVQRAALTLTTLPNHLKKLPALVHSVASGAQRGEHSCTAPDKCRALPAHVMKFMSWML